MADLDTTMRKVALYLRECVGDFVDNSDGTMSFPFGSTRVVVSGSEDTVQDATFVHFRAHIAHQVPITDDLYRWLATTSNDLLFGRLTLNRDANQPSVGELNLEHTLLGDWLDPAELRVVVAFLAARGDELDDTIVDHFGGSRFVDSGSDKPDG